MVRTLLFGAALVVGAAALLVVWGIPDRSALVGRPAGQVTTTSAQLSFEPVTKVPHCADYYGTGTPPKEGHAVLFIQPPDASTVYYGTELTFDSTGWSADDVVLGEQDDVRHFTLYIYAVTAQAGEWLKHLPPQHPLELMPVRLLDVMVVIRDNGPDTC